MRRKNVFVAALAVTTALITAMPCYAGWYQTQDNRWYCTDDSTGAVYKNCWLQDTDSKWSVVGSDGYMVANRWVLDTDGSWYFVNGEGYLLKGTFKIPAHYNYYSLAEGDYVACNLDAGSYSFDADGCNY